MCDLISPRVYETLKRVVKSDVENFEIIFHDENKKGEGNMSKILFITLRHKETGKEFDIIVKQAFTDKPMRDCLPVRDAFINEIFFYAKIFPAFDKFQERIAPIFQFKTVPRYFASVSDDNCENLILENLKIQNFELHDKKTPFDKDHFELVLKELGKFHGLSFAYKALHPEKYKHLTSGLVDIYSGIVKKEFFIKGMQYVNEICLESLQPGRDDDLMKKLRPFVENCKEILADCVVNKTKYTVIVHGDCWSNNMMFKYNEIRQVIDVRLFDFQAVRDVSPCFDLAHCIYSGASKEILENLDYYLQVYHSSVSATIREFGCDPEKLYPLEQLKKDFRLHCHLGFITALLILKVRFSNEEEVLDFTDVEEEEQEKIVQAPYDKEAFIKVSRDLLLHFYKNDFFKSI